MTNWLEFKLNDANSMTVRAVYSVPYGRETLLVKEWRNYLDIMLWNTNKEIWIIYVYYSAGIFNM